MRKVHRRRFLLASSALLAEPLTTFAQPAPKVHRIGMLSPGTAFAAQQFWRDSLRRTGYEEGKNLAIEWRFAEGKVERLAELAEDLVQLHVELIVVSGNDAADAAKHATLTIPIVMFANLFPVERGLIKSLAHPGGNVTGTVWWANPQETRQKTLQIIKDAVPKAKRVSWLMNPTDPQYRFYDVAQMDRIADAMGLSVQSIAVSRPDGHKAILDLVASSRPDVLFVGASLYAFDFYQEAAAFAIKRKLVSLSDGSSYVSAGGLLSYGPNIYTLVDRSVSYVDRILRGAQSGNLPVEQATKWELVLNTKTAAAIGFRPSSSFLAGVDRQVE